MLGSAQQDYREEQWTDERGVSCSSLELCNTPFRSVSICAQYCVLNNARLGVLKPLKYLVCAVATRVDFYNLPFSISHTLQELKHLHNSS